jgi:hypothetical protein
LYTDISQGEAQYACRSIGDGYHLITENEWLTINENILRIAQNDGDPAFMGMQLAYFNDPAATTTYILSNGNEIQNLACGLAEWTDQTVTRNGCPVSAVAGDWTEYADITNFNGLDIAPAYYLTHAANGIGRIKTAGEEAPAVIGFVRGATSVYDLDLTISPSTATSTVGFRCAK